MLLQKSAENLQACELLIQNRLYTASVHHAYYACFQVATLLLSKRWNWSFTGQGDSHKETIQTLCDRLHDDEEYGASYRLDQGLSHLRRERAIADYKDRVFYERESMATLNKAKELSTLLASLFINL